MVVRLIFDSRISYVYVPDGYITDAKSLRCPFIEWVYDNPHCMVKAKGHTVFSFGENDFVSFINAVVLRGKNEKAYVCPCENLCKQRILSINL